MTNSEINEFLGSYDAKQELVEKLETLQKTLEHAMQPLFEPKYKEDDHRSEAAAHLGALEGLSPHAISLGYLIVCEALVSQGCNLEEDENAAVVKQVEVKPYQFRFQLQHLADLSGWSLTTVKRHIHQLFAEKVVYRCPKKHGWYICSLD